MTTPELITAVKDSLVGIAAATTAVVAFLGLHNWSRELKGRAEFEIARNLIKATYKLRNEIQNCRMPFYSANEFPNDYSGWGERSPEVEAKAWVHIYKNRWAPVWAALQEFDTNTLEAEALWGDIVRSKTDELRQCVKELNIAFDSDIRDKASGGKHFESDRKFGEKIRKILTAAPDDKENALSRRIGEAIAEIEEQIRPHLRRG